MLSSISSFPEMATHYHCHLLINDIQYNALDYPRNQIMCLAALSLENHTILPVKNNVKRKNRLL